MTDVFLSYARDDWARIKPIHQLLVAKGLSVFWDQEIAVGQDWDQTIRSQLAVARVVIVFWSKRSVESKNVCHEARIANEQKKLIPALLDKLSVNQFPLGCDATQAAQLGHWTGNSGDPQWIKFLSAVSARLGPMAPQMAPSPTPRAGGMLSSIWGTGRNKPPRELPADALLSPRQISQGFAPIPVAVGSGQHDETRMLTPGSGRFEWFRDLPITPDMVVVPTGIFYMGGDGADGDGPSRPKVRRTIDAPFAIGRFVVTIDEWMASINHQRALTSYTPEAIGVGGGNRPVVHVSLDDAMHYIEWLCIATGKHYRLLTEVEWEFCCRAGTTTAFYTGDQISHGQALFRARTLGSVGQFPPNPFGLFDMHGLVWEGCLGYIVRGGSWFNYDYDLKSARREWWGDRDKFTGFRVARTLS